MARDEEFPILDDDEEQEVSKKTSQEAVIPNFRGKIPEAEVPERTGPVQVEWASDDSEDEDDEEEDEQEGEVVEGEVAKEGEEKEGAVAKKRRLRSKRRDDEEEDESDEEVLEEEDEWNFPRDEENWTEADLGEVWAEPTPADDTVGHDPELAEDDEELIAKLEKDGRAPPRKPYYVPYRKWYPPIPEGHPDIDSPEAVVEELERMEEFLVWASYIFEDGSSYEGTVWDDLAHGKGVYTTPLELCRYEGEWLQNMMDGHGVIEVDLPVPEPPPGSDLAKKMKEQGRILKADYLKPEDKEWLKMDLEDTLADNPDAIDPAPFEDDELWVKYFGEKPEKGHYKYAGQWKHSRMHGCGIYEINGRQIWGKFYFGELLPDLMECDDKQSAMHASLAEVAAAKARMFVNKPDGMVREWKGPFTDPQHPYMYEEEDLWMAPGFINAYYKVPELWERYVKEVDDEQEMWLNSFIKSPLRIPMPPELEYLWSKDDEFVVLAGPNSEDESNGDKSKDRPEEDEVLLHVPSGQIINWATDAEGRMRLFVQPLADDGSVIPELAIPLPMGMKEFLGEEGDEGDEGEGGEGKLTEKEKLKKQWEEEDAERRQQWEAEDELGGRVWTDKERELALKLEIKDLDAKLQEAMDQAEYEAKLEDLYAKEVPKEGADTSEGKGEAGGAEGGPQEEGPPEGGKPSEVDDGGKGDDDEDEDQDPKPRSFGKVAMATPAGEMGGIDKGHPPFPTVFASLSLVSQTTMKQMMEFAVGKSTKSWLTNFVATAPPSRYAGAMRLHKSVERNSQTRSLPICSLSTVKFRVSHPVDTTRLRTVAPLRINPAVAKSHSRLASNGATAEVFSALSLSLSCCKSKHDKRQGKGYRIKSRLNTKLKTSKVPSRSVESLWVVPGMEFLSLALPLDI